MKRILITGAYGQIGTELSSYLRDIYGEHFVVTSHFVDKGREESKTGKFEVIDVTQMDHIERAVITHDIDTIIHLAAVLSAKAEKRPHASWRVNMDGLTNVLEVALKHGLQVFHPSSIGAFGPSSPQDHTPQICIQRPTSIYGVSKVAGEILSDYYVHTLGVDVRGLRFPGLVSYVALPGGGTTDYAVDIYYQALKYGKYTSYLREDTYLDMMYMPDALKSIVQLMETDKNKLHHYNAYNVSAMSICPKDMEHSIRKFIPDFKIDYEIDPVRQAIADSWPNSLDISEAQNDWGFNPEYNLDRMTEDMLKRLKEKGI